MYVKENNALLGYDTANSGNSLPTFRNNPSVPYYFSVASCPLKMAPIYCPEKFVTNYRYSLRYSPGHYGCHLRRGGNGKLRLHVGSFHTIKEGSENSTRNHVLRVFPVLPQLPLFSRFYTIMYCPFGVQYGNKGTIVCG